MPNGDWDQPVESGDVYLRATVTVPGARGIDEQQEHLAVGMNRREASYPARIVHGYQQGVRWRMVGDELIPVVIGEPPLLRNLAEEFQPARTEASNTVPMP